MLTNYTVEIHGIKKASLQLAFDVNVGFTVLCHNEANREYNFGAP